MTAALLGLIVGATIALVYCGIRLGLDGPWSEDER